MADKKYTGPERRSKTPERRGPDRRSKAHINERFREWDGGIRDADRAVHTVPEVMRERSGDRPAGPGRYRFNTGLGRSGVQHIGDTVGIGADESMAQISPITEETQRRQGAGRRRGDLRRAILSPSRDTVFDLSKMKNIGKLAKKAAKHIPAIGIAAGIYDLVNRAKQ